MDEKESRFMKQAEQYAGHVWSGMLIVFVTVIAVTLIIPIIPMLLK